MTAATVVQVLQDLFYALLYVLVYLWSLLKGTTKTRLKIFPQYSYMHMRLGTGCRTLDTLLKNNNSAMKC